MNNRNWHKKKTNGIALDRNASIPQLSFSRKFRSNTTHIFVQGNHSASIDNTWVN
jgi:hypothetical protein